MTMSEAAASVSRRHRQTEGDSDTRDVIVDAAIDAMFENGYHGTSVREIADRAGMSVANVYYYFPSKHDLLFSFMSASADQLQRQLEETLERTPEDPRRRLSAAVRVFVERHTIRQAAAFVAATELRALEPEARRTVVAKRDAIEQVFREIVAHGIDRGVFTADDPGLAVRAILDMGSSVSSWYRAGGKLAGSEIGDRYVEFSLAVVGVRKRSPGRPRPG
jgi:AcrR family transcriptional regulator